MEMTKYLPTPELRKEFEEFKTLKTVEEKKAFQQKRVANLANKSVDDANAYLEACNAGLKNTIQRAEEVIMAADIGALA
jgi:hypothetical protein